MHKTAVIYARVSTARQASDELPIDGQIQGCQDKAATLGAKVARVFTDAGISGRDEQRPAFQEAVAYAVDNKADYFITWSTSRFARDQVTAVFYKKRLRKAGVEMVYCTMTVDPDSTSGFLLEGVYELFDELYSRTVSTDTRRSLMKNAADGHWNGGGTPYGYQRVPSPANSKRSKLAAEPSEAWLVQQAFKLRLQGLGLRLIAQRLNEAGHAHRGKPWTKAQVQGLLRNPAVIGQVVFNRRDRKGGNTWRPESEWVRVTAHEPLIDVETWEKVQATMDDLTHPHAGSPLSMHLFTGMLRCGHCGASMQIETAKGRSQRYSYYNCSAWQKQRQCINQRRNADEVDSWLMESIREKVFTVSALREVAEQLNLECGRAAQDRKGEIKALKKESDEQARRKAKLLDVLELQGRDAPNLADIGERLREINSALRSKAEKIREIESQPDQAFEVSEELVLELRESMMQIISDPAKAKATRTLLGRFIDTVLLHSEYAQVNYRQEFMADMKRQNIAVHTSHKWLPVHALLGTKSVRLLLPAGLVRAA